MKMFLTALLSLLIVTSVSLATLAKPVTFVVDDKLGWDSVSFTSNAPIELIVGRTTKIKGQIIIDDSLNLKKLPPKVSFEVDLASIDTGIPLRNEHMRDNFLEIKKYPKATFNVKKITSDSIKLADGKTVRLNAFGDFSVHGVTLPKNITVKVTYFKESDFTHSKFEHGDVIKIQSTFDVSLPEHKIKRPEIIMQKLADKAVVSVDAFASQAVEN